MAWYRCGGGNGGNAGATASLVLEAYAYGRSHDNQFPRQDWTSNHYDSAYFSYSTSIYKWTAQKDFFALVILINDQWKSGSSGNSYSTARVDSTFAGGNFSSLTLNPCTSDYLAGTYAVEYGFVKIKQGDTVLEGKQNSWGWEAPYFYILDANGTDAITNLANGANVSFTTNAQGYAILQNYFDF